MLPMKVAVGGYRNYGEDSESIIKSRNHNNGHSTLEILDIEIDRGCESCQNNCVCNADNTPIPLFRYHEIPNFLRGNPYVLSGYRAFLPFSLCCKSMFMWTNETINIWSHLLGFLLFFILTVYDNLVTIPSVNGSVSDHIVITLGMLCYQFCMLCSTGYHLFYCHSERASKRWLALDLAGVSIGLIGCYLPAVHYAFYCLSLWRDVYLIVITLLSGAVLFLQLHPQYLSSSWHHKRLLLYCSLVGYGVIPTIHWIYLNGGFSHPLVQIFVPKVIVMYILGILALFFYATKFPERCLPGRVDFLGSSHQIWHFIVVAAFLWARYSSNELLSYRVHDVCDQGV